MNFDVVFVFRPHHSVSDNGLMDIHLTGAGHILPAWRSQSQALTTLVPSASSRRGSSPTPTAWTTWSRCAGRPGLSVRNAATLADGGWRLGDGRFTCTDCGNRTSVTAGTIFDRTRTPLTVWFAACWNFACGKDGISALSLKRTLQIGSYQTAWAMLHRLRSALVRPSRELLRGKVEVDETYIGGLEPGLTGGRAQGKKVITCIAVEILEPQGVWPLQYGARRGHLGGVAAGFRVGKRRAGGNGDHRRLTELTRIEEERLYP
jgi:hypothetical protein